MWRNNYVGILLLLGQLSYSQENKVFSFHEFYLMVLENHPIAKQANLLGDLAKSDVLVAKGMFDTKYEMEITQKYLQGQSQFSAKEQGTNYYTYLNNGLKVPLWFGPDIQLGFEDNTGKLVNPSNYTPSGGYAYLGLKIPLIQGMVIDERRAAIKQAKIMQNIAENERVKLINKVLFAATKEYFDWVFVYKKYVYLNDSYRNGLERFEGIRERARNGDLAEIDTLESLNMLQERSLDLQFCENELANAQLGVSTYLWSPNNEPLELGPGLIPDLNSVNLETLTKGKIKELLESGPSLHPELLKLDNKLLQLELEVKLARDKLLPNFDLDYKYLTSNISGYLGEFSGNYFANNYKVGFTLQQPIFLSKERGKIQMAKIKLNQTQFERNLAFREITNTIAKVSNALEMYRSQFELQQKMVGNTKALRDAELEKFALGESSVFLVNARESKFIDSQIKLADLGRKLEKAKFELLYEAGVYGLKLE